MFSIGGSTIGVFGLDEVISEVAALEPLTEEQRFSELLSRFRKQNYFPDSARNKYGEALLAEYKKYITETTKENVEGLGKVIDIKVLGPGCKNCRTLESAVLQALEELGVEASVEKVENPKKIVEMGVLMTPGLVINGKVKSTGRMPKNDDILKWIKEEI
jgi:small redox-active disulfide protein 2